MNNTDMELNQLQTELYIPYTERPETYIVPIIFLIIFVAGVLGNGTLVYIFVEHRFMRNVPNTYILSLALADLLVIITNVPFTSIIYTVESWPWGELICKISETAKDISVAVSVFTLTALSADRFFAIVNPLNKVHVAGGSRAATRTTIAIATLIWLLSCICATPAAIGSHVRHIHDEAMNVSFNVCYPFPVEWLEGTYPKVNVLTRFFLLYILPLSIIAVFYLNMANHLLVSTRNVPGEVQGTHRQVCARRKVAFTVLVFVVIFAICFLPYYVGMLAFYFDPNFQENYNIYWHCTRIIGFCLCYINSCVNPIALYCISGTFRKHFNRYLFCTKNDRTGYIYQDQPVTILSTISSRRSQSTSNRIRSNETESFQSLRGYSACKERRPESHGLLMGNGNRKNHLNITSNCKTTSSS